MQRSIGALLVAGVMAFTSPLALAENPIPEQRVRIHGATTEILNHAPSAMGSDVFGNVGAGSNASPYNDIITPANPPHGTDPNPLPGTSGSITITR
jgi:hypothetical protein